MSLYSWMHQLSPSVCLHLLCLLLLLSDSSSSTVPKKGAVVPADSQTQLNTTQGNDGTASDDATAEDLSKTSSSGVATDPLQKIVSSVSEFNNTSAIFNQSSLPGIVTSPTFVDSKDTQQVESSPNASSAPSTASPSTQQPVTPDRQLPSSETVTQPAGVFPFTPSDSSTQSAQTGSTSTSMTTASTAEPVGREHTVTTTSPHPTTTQTTPTPTTAGAPPRPPPATAGAPPRPPPATAGAPPRPPPTTVAATLPVTTTIATKLSPSSPSAARTKPGTGMPPVQTTSSATGTATTTVTTTTSSSSHNKPLALATRVAVVQVAGAALTRQLVDTASLLAVLLFGLLFFLVTVAVFVTQAYEGYRRKDYTQVDYLINGMYSDSGV